MNDFVPQFLLEARELTEQATGDLLALEQAPKDGERLEGAFRAFHTLKGAAAIMEYAAMERMLHRAEDVLQNLRRGEAFATSATIDGCLACLGQVVRWLDAIERSGELPADADTAAQRIIGLLDGPDGSPVVHGSEAWQDALLLWALAELGDSVAASARFAVRFEPASDVFFRGEDPLALVSAMPGLVALRTSPRLPWPAPRDMQPFDSNLVFEALSSAAREEIAAAFGGQRPDLQIVAAPARRGAATQASIELAVTLIKAQDAFLRASRSEEAYAGAVGAAGQVAINVLRSLGRDAETTAIAAAVARATDAGDAQVLLEALSTVLRSLSQGARAPEPSAGDLRSEGAGSIRVDVDKIDAIVDLTGELLVLKTAIAHLARMSADGADLATVASALRTHSEKLDRHVTDLQRSVLDLRVLPLGRVFGRFPLLVRETAARLGKQVEFRTEGDHTVADKAVVEALFEPLLHVVRNAIDHGIETPAQRRSSDKSPAATLLMKAWREGELVIVEVADDGRGVDPQTIRRLAVARGVASQDMVDTLDDAEAAELIFAPGFTTASSITELSGRGVGMNAVRSALQRMGGHVSLANMPGRGLTVRLMMPFTVMMTRIITVEAGGQVFGLPFDRVIETTRIPREQMKPLGGGQAFVLRDTTIPVVSLAERLDLHPGIVPRHHPACLVIASVAGQRVGIEVDRLGEQLDLMLKPVEGLLSSMRAISGTSLLGDGRVLIVLDLEALLS